jgi:hypothetical protein
VKLSKLRTRFGAPGVLAVIALVFALVGGAGAAGGGLSGKQKKEVKKIARTEAKKLVGAGPAGPPGAAGPQGPPGTPGKNGADGAPGSPGSAGKSVVTAAEPAGANCAEGGTSVEVAGSGTKEYVCNGEAGVEGVEGPEGPEGSPWTAGGTLPSNKSEFGTYSAGPLPAGGAFDWASISFVIPLASSVPVHYMAEGAAPTTPCPGTVSDPAAAAGNMCVYQRSTGFDLEFTVEENPEAPTEETTEVGTGKSGVNLQFFGEEFQSARGVWVVTAP